MKLDLATPLLSTDTVAAVGKDSSKLAGAARQFESLLIGEMLKSARESGSDGWLGEGDSGEESAMGLAETHFAQAIANRGGLGLAKTIERSIAGQVGAAQAAQKENAVPDNVSSAGSLQ